MRILLISDYGTPTGGAELMLLALRKGLRERGHDARLMASSARPLDQASQADYECFGLLSQLRGLHQIWNPSAFLSLRRVLREFQPDVVHVRLFLSQISPAILPLLRDLPAIYHVAWYRCICPIGTKMLPDGASCQEPAGVACLRHRCFPAYAWPSLMLQMKLWRQWRDSFDLIVANSHATKRKLEMNGIQPVEVVWNGVPLRPPRGPLAARPTVSFAGRLRWEKGPDILLDAFAQVVARIPDALLLIAGEGPERARLASQIGRLRLDPNVSFLGHLSRTEMEDRFARVWVHAIPSRWEEPFGITAAEGMMRGAAVVSSNTGGLAEFIRQGETGILVSPQDPQPMADALLSLLKSPERTERLGRQGRDFAIQHLTEDVFINRFESLYESLCPTRTAAFTI
jgi:glycosyltransferase involved in cell wall biosynthesis